VVAQLFARTVPLVIAKVRILIPTARSAILDITLLKLRALRALIVILLAMVDLCMHISVSVVARLLSTTPINATSLDKRYVLPVKQTLD
jgi:hypothetical protein